MLLHRDVEKTYVRPSLRKVLHDLGPAVMASIRRRARRALTREK